MAKTLVVLTLFYLFGWLLFSHKLTDIPPGINGDEAAIGYLASVISKTGKDLNGNRFPLFVNYSWPDWKQPVTIYSTALGYKLFGVSFFNLRAVSIFFALFGGTIIYFLTKEILGQKLAVLSLLIFATIPIVLVQSHLAIENIAPLPFVALWLWMMAKYMKIKKARYLVFAGLALGISLYSYLGMRLVVPVLASLSIGFTFYINKSKKSFIKPTLLYLLSLAPFFLLMLKLKNQYPGAIFALNRPQEITTYQQFFLPYVSSFDLSFLFLRGDVTTIHSTGNQGMFLLASLPLFLIGLFKIARHKKPFLLFIVLVFLLTPFLYGLPGVLYRASRLLALIPPFVVITLIGIGSLFEIKKKVARLLIISLFAVLLSLNYIDFAADYWFEHSNRVKQDFEKPIHRVFESASTISKIDNLDVFIQEDVVLRNPTAYLFFENAYFPNGLGRWKEGKDLRPKSLTIISTAVNNRLHKTKDTETINMSEFDLIILINK